MKALLYFFALLLYICSCNNNSVITDSGNEIITVDLSKEYPRLDIKLSDLADVSFIALEGRDSVNFLTDLNELNGNICIDGDLLIIGDCLPSNGDIDSKSNNEIYLFDTCGHFLKSFGAGNKKANSMTSLKNMRVFPSENIIGIHNLIAGEQPIVFYDYMGNIVRIDTLDKTYYYSVPFGKNLVLYDHHSSHISMFTNKHIDRGRTINVYNIDTGVYESIEDIRYKNILNSNKQSANTHIYSSGDKVYISSPRTDTVYVLDKNLKITAQFKSKNSYKSDPEIQNIICPIIETSKYIIFCNSMDYQSQMTKRFGFGNWIYVKKEAKIYCISDMGFLEYAASKDNSTYFNHLLNDKIFLTPKFNTQNSDILICALSPQSLKENFTKLPIALQKIAVNMKIDDNPVLMVMKFGENKYFLKNKNL